jgi:hypothetical protein
VIPRRRVALAAHVIGPLRVVRVTRRLIHIQNNGLAGLISTARRDPA